MQKPQPGRYRLISEEFIDLTEGPARSVTMLKVADTAIERIRYKTMDVIGLLPLDRLEALVASGLAFEPLTLPDGRLLTFSDSEEMAEEARAHKNSNLVTRRRYAAVVAAADSPRRAAPSDRKRRLIRFDFYNRTGRYPTVEEWAELRSRPPAHLQPKLQKIDNKGKVKGKERSHPGARNRTNLS